MFTDFVPAYVRSLTNPQFSPVLDETVTAVSSISNVGESLNLLTFTLKFNAYASLSEIK
jgi:hypothetical protein